MLVGGGALLVRGASEIAMRLGVSPLVIGLTVVGFGTSSPELVVNILGSIRGETGLAFGNVLGSNVSNLALVLGAAALMSPIMIQGQLMRREVPLLLLATAVLAAMALDGPLEGHPSVISRSEAVVLLLLFCIFIYINAVDFVLLKKAEPLAADVADYPLIATAATGRWGWLMVVGGLALLVLGGEMTVRGGVAIANTLGVSPAVVGLFMVAVGTSMPELATSIIAAIKRESDLALGNIIGSNIFNTLVVLPASGLIGEVPVPRGGIGDVAVSLGLAAMLIPVFLFGKKGRLGRPAGGLLLVGYVVYVIARIAYDRT